MAQDMDPSDSPIDEEEMRLILWNCRRCRSHPAIRNLKSLLRFTSLIITFILKTHSNMHQFTNTIRDLHVPSYNIVSAAGLSGGLWLFWDNIHSLHIISSSSNYIVAEIQLATRLPVWNLVCFYREPAQRNRREFWEPFSSIVFNLTLPILCFGDFNAISSQIEMYGCEPVTWNKTEYFNKILSTCRLFDLGFHGAVFTWSNKQIPATHVHERLDKGSW